MLEFLDFLLVTITFNLRNITYLFPTDRTVKSKIGLSQ